MTDPPGGKSTAWQNPPIHNFPLYRALTLEPILTFLNMFIDPFGQFLFIVVNVYLMHYQKIVYNFTSDS